MTRPKAQYWRVGSRKKQLNVFGNQAVKTTQSTIKKQLSG
jgi:hypothetical protein